MKKPDSKFKLLTSAFFIDAPRTLPLSPKTRREEEIVLQVRRRRSNAGFGLIR